MQLHGRTTAFIGLVAIVLASPATCLAGIIETETARFLHRGQFELDTGFEFQSSSEGTERAVPLAGELGVTNRLAVMVEPVPYTAIRPKHGPRATGPGDFEVTALGLVRDEAGPSPAFALGIEVKIPTAHNTLIGTGETDVTGYLIASKHFARLDVHANLGYSVLGQPPGTHLNNVWSGALAAELAVHEMFGLYGEVLGSTSSSGEGGDTPNPNPSTVVIPEAAGGELIATIGLTAHLIPQLLLSFGFSYDNNQALQVRPG